VSINLIDPKWYGIEKRIGELTYSSRIGGPTYSSEKWTSVRERVLPVQTTIHNHLHHCRVINLLFQWVHWTDVPGSVDDPYVETVDYLMAVVKGERDRAKQRDRWKRIENGL
jgi:hypothetical protein